jgi:hypothetical protein
VAKIPSVKGVEVDDGQNIEPVVSQEFGKAVSEEAFMNELLVIELATTTSEEDPQHVIVNVNNVAQPLMRGVPFEVKRKYVEVLARCKETKYKQPHRNMDNPEPGNQLVGRTALTYPFTVIEDKNPIGRAWLKAVLAEAA